MTYKMGQRLEICNFVNIKESPVKNGDVVVVVALPGFSKEYPASYGILFTDGKVRGVNPEFLQLWFGVPNIKRGDTDNPSTWESFEKDTGISRMSIILGPQQDY